MGISDGGFSNPKFLADQRELPSDLILTATTGTTRERAGQAA